MGKRLRIFAVVRTPDHYLASLLSLPLSKKPLRQMLSFRWNVPYDNYIAGRRKEDTLSGLKKYVPDAVSFSVSFIENTQDLRFCPGHGCRYGGV